MILATTFILLGLLGSLHCAAMCGPLMLALPITPGGPARFIAGRIFYQLGRTATYCLLGLLAGSFGKSLALAGLQNTLSLALGFAILIGFLFSKKISVAAPIIRLVMTLKSAMSAQLQRRDFSSLILLGMLNGLLPCGLVYVALAGAVSTGAIFQSAICMALFGLGTFPVMFSFSVGKRLLPISMRLRTRTGLMLGVCLVSGLLILRGLALGIPYLSPDLASAKTPSCCALRN